MHVFSLEREQQWDPKHHVEKILGKVADGDVTVACWEPGQISPYHCHPEATEIYFCFSGGGTMRTPEQTVAVTPGGFIVHPPGEVHEYANTISSRQLEDEQNSRSSQGFINRASPRSAIHPEG